VKEKIGFIGLGIMGRPMATNLLNAGFSLSVYDIRPEPVEEVVTLGAEKCSSSSEASTDVDVVITMLPDSPDVEDVYFGNDGVLSVVKPGTVLIDMSTIAPAVAIKVATAANEKGCPMLDAPVSGGDVGAREGTLSIMVGGDEDIFKQALPIFEVLGHTITLCGPNGAGQIVKACNQIQVALNFVGMAEALVLGTKAGVDPAIIIQVLSGGYAQTRVMDVRGPRVIQGDFTPGFRSKFHFKDLNIILQTGRDFGCPLPVTALVRQLFSAMLAAGRGDLDHSGIITVLEDLAKVQARTREAGQTNKPV
jgi:2-hydroxy-3-oxopropionate reductase